MSTETGDGARYSRPSEESVRRWTDASEREGHTCLNCDADVLALADGECRDMARRICRVFGDDDDNIYRCPACTGYGRLSVAAKKGIRIEMGGATLMRDCLGGEI